MRERLIHIETTKVINTIAKMSVEGMKSGSKHFEAAKLKSKNTKKGRK
jgi:hypothetical protein